MDYIATISSKGQITLPARLRRSLQVNPGDRIKFAQKGKHYVVEADDYEQRLAELRASVNAELASKGFTPEALRAMAQDYQNGSGLSAHVKEKYAKSS